MLTDHIDQRRLEVYLEDMQFLEPLLRTAAEENPAAWAINAEDVRSIPIPIGDDQFRWSRFEDD